MIMCFRAIYIDFMRRKKKKEEKAEIEYQSIIDAEISENEELRKIFKENEKWDKIAELG